MRPFYRLLYRSIIIIQALAIFYLLPFSKDNKLETNCSSWSILSVFENVDQYSVSYPLLQAKRSSAPTLPLDWRCYYYKEDIMKLFLVAGKIRCYEELKHF